MRSPLSLLYTLVLMDSPIFRITFSVQASDIDPLGHANNIAYVRWIQDAAVGHSAAVGLDYTAYQRMGAVFVVRRHEIDYLRPLLRGDLIEARTWVRTVMAAKCERATELVRTADGALVARGSTIWGFVDVATGRPTRIPEEVRVAFTRAPDEDVAVQSWHGA